MIHTTVSHIEKVKRQHQLSDVLIQTLMDWSADQLNEFRYVMGINYASHVTGNDEMGLKMLIESQYFWAWWRNEWAKRDDLFISTHAASTNIAMLSEEYAYSNGYGLTTGRLGELMDKMSASMIGMAIDEHLKQEREVTI